MSNMGLLFYVHPVYSTQSVSVYSNMYSQVLLTQWVLLFEIFVSNN